jgi:hypothetical protein
MVVRALHRQRRERTGQEGQERMVARALHRQQQRRERTGQVGQERIVVRAPHRHNSKGENGQDRRDRKGWSKSTA